MNDIAVIAVRGRVLAQFGDQVVPPVTMAEKPAEDETGPIATGTAVFPAINEVIMTFRVTVKSNQRSHLARLGKCPVMRILISGTRRRRPRRILEKLDLRPHLIVSHR